MLTNPLLGTWRLVSFEIENPEGEVSRPFGENAAGYLMYSADGYMAVSIMPLDRPNFLSSTLDAGKPEEKIGAFDTYTSYCGTYEIRGDTVVHHIELCLFPKWSGADQHRQFELSGDRLTLRARLKMAEGESVGVAIWNRISPRRK